MAGEKQKQSTIESEHGQSVRSTDGCGTMAVDASRHLPRRDWESGGRTTQAECNRQSWRIGMDAGKQDDKRTHSKVFAAGSRGKTDIWRSAAIATARGINGAFDCGTFNGWAVTSINGRHSAIVRNIATCV